MPRMLKRRETVLSRTPLLPAEIQNNRIQVRSSASGMRLSGEARGQSGRTVSLTLAVRRLDGLLLGGLLELLERVGELFHEVRKGR